MLDADNNDGYIDKENITTEGVPENIIVIMLPILFEIAESP